MPELPEVDSYRTGLAKPTKGWEIEGGEAIWPRALDADFKKIKGGKEFDINQDWYISMMQEIGQKD